ncbi:MAG: cupin domain-containing protein [Gammaproteobacteria bacterium]|jgi:mannose-6-phosphate isomerase-like protein (cupin superfamily)
MPKSVPIDLSTSFDGLRFLADRTPTTASDESRSSFTMLSEIRDGGVFVSAFAGASEWERHANGDELVMAVEGATDLILLVDGEEVRHRLSAGQLLIVPQNTWHRFETRGVHILTVTPQPTDHCSDESPPDT